MGHHQCTTGTRTLTGQQRERGAVRNETEFPAAPKPCDILRPRKGTPWIDLPPQHATSPTNVFPLFPFGRVANLLTYMLVEIISAGDELFGWLV